MRKTGKTILAASYCLSLSPTLPYSFSQVTVPLEKSRGLLPPGSFIKFEFQHNNEKLAFDKLEVDNGL